MLKSLRRIHEDERGLETLQVVFIIAIAAIVLALVKYFWDTAGQGGAKGWAQGLVTKVLGWNQ
jgi:hypothetical protein